MKLKSLTNISTLAPLAFFFLPLIALAQASGLVPCGNNALGDYVSNTANYMAATSCNFCNLAQLVQNIVNFLIMVSIPISVAMFAWAGIIMFTNAGNPKKITRAKSIFSSVFIGFIIAVSGWLVVQVILQTITNSQFYNAASWTALSCTADRPRNANIANVISGNGLQSVPTTPGNPTTPGGDSTTGFDPNNNSVQAAASSVALQAACNNNPGVDCTLLQATCVVESGCGQNVGGANGCNNVGACGPMQILPATACSTAAQSGTAVDGCSSNGQVQNPAAVQAALQDAALSANLAAKILTSASNTCNGDMTCMVAVYNGGPGAVGPSACCPTGAAYSCQWDCNSSTPRSVDCTSTPQPSACVQNKGFVETRNYVTKIQAAQALIKTVTAPVMPNAN